MHKNYVHSHIYTEQVWWVLGQYSDACDLLWVQFSPLLLIKEYFTFPLLSWSLLRQWNVKNEDGDWSQNAIAGHVLGISVNIYIYGHITQEKRLFSLYIWDEGFYAHSLNVIFKNFNHEIGIHARFTSSPVFFPSWDALMSVLKWGKKYWSS